MRQIITRAMRQADDLVLVFDYRDSKGIVTRRVVSPVRFLAADRFLASDRFLALCLSREEPRQFYLERCTNLRLDWAANFVMPVPVVEVIPESATAANERKAVRSRFRAISTSLMHNPTNIRFNTNPACARYQPR